MSRARIRDDLAALEGYHSPQVDVEVRLNTNESPLPPPEGFADALAAEVGRIDWNRYPDRAATELRQALADHHGVAIESVFAANGSNEILQSLLLAYGGPGRSAMTFEPTYAMHGQICRSTGTELVQIDRDDAFEVDTDLALAAIAEHQPNVVFLCSPNNPTGTVDSPELAMAAADALAEWGGLVVVDEAYGQFAERSALELVADDRSIVVTRTYSKTWAMAAARIGYLVGPTWLITDLELVVLPYHLDTMSQIAGRLALDFTDEMNARVALLVEERGRLSTNLSDLDIDVFPSGANFILIRPRTKPADELWRALVDRSVLVRNCASWPRLPGCLRITVGTPEENVRLIAAIKDSL